ncbi:F-box protein [Phanerochaete sordida]|uniref:F-box protein n=1 Tax=Phanerochaete sordida TaxID=48140 RepID=A0A9P3GMF3_9APHY|nr:F-box protein [Phanerochaete sordida]
MPPNEVLSPRPVRSWMPIPSTSPPPYEELVDFSYEKEDPVPTASSSTEPFIPLTPEPIHVFSPIPNPPSVHPWLARAGSGESVDHLRDALSDLETRMAMLLSERDVLEHRLESAVRLQSPVHRLPSELLASIFIACVLTMEEEDSLMLTTLMLVCRHWKEVTLNTPIVWSRVVAGTHHPLSNAYRKLERSKSCPMNISVDFSPRTEYSTVSTDSIVRTMDLLRTSIWRWKSFRLTVPNRPQASAALMRCKDPAPLLEVLSVHILHSMQDDGMQHSNPPRPVFNGQTPSLTSCSMTSFNFGWDMHLVSRLRVLKLGGYWNGYAPSLETTLAMLRACPHLEEFSLRNMSDIDIGACQEYETDPAEYDELYERFARTGDTRMIQLPRLTKLSFYYSGTVRSRIVLGLLSCPALEDVDLCFLDNVSPMIEHLRRQSLTKLPLRRLRIESSFFSELKLARFLRRVPSLTTLDLVDVEDASPSLLKNLAAPATSQSWACPKLTHLSLEGCTTLDWESIRSVVESRLPPQARAFPRPATDSKSPSRGFSSASSAAQRPPIASSSASAFAANAHILAHTPSTALTRTSPFGQPQRLQCLDLTRCHQLSKEMIQWLRLYVEDVKCDTSKNVWE